MREPSKRLRQITDLLKHEIAMLFKKEVRDPRLTNISITSVEVSPDLSMAKVYYSLLDKAELSEAKKALEKIQGFIRHALSKTTELRRIPQIRFYYDDSIIAAEELSNLIKRSVKDDDSDTNP